MFNQFQQLGSQTRQNIVDLLCDNQINTDIGCKFLAEMRHKVAETYPDLLESEQLKLTAMAYNGGQGAIKANLDEPTKYIGNIKRYWEGVSSHLEKAKFSLGNSV
jgi:membrane-bound lytic murein transglycosylase MltF